MTPALFSFSFAMVATGLTVGLALTASCVCEIILWPKGIEGTEAAMNFQEELNYFIANQDQLVAAHGGKFLAIKGQAVIGVYSTAFEALQETRKTYPPGSFMIQSCQPGTGAYTVRITSHRIVL